MESDQNPFMAFLGATWNRVDHFFSTMHISVQEMIWMVTYCGIGFFIGMLFRRYGSWIVLISLMSIFLMLISSYFNIITVHTAYIKCLLGLADVHGFSDFFQCAQQWLVDKYVFVVSSIVGFIVGFKLG